MSSAAETFADWLADQLPASNVRHEAFDLPLERPSPPATASATRPSLYAEMSRQLGHGRQHAWLERHQGLSS